MTTISITQQKMWSWIWEVGFYRELITRSLISVLIILIGGYLVALPIIFDLGFEIQAAEENLAKVREQKLVLELELQRKEQYIWQEHKNIIESMESISAIKYILPDSVAVSYPKQKP